MSRREDSGSGTNAATFVALGMLLLVGGGMLALIATVWVNVLFVAIVPFGLALLGAFHYLVWGWWFSAGADGEEE